MDHLQTRLEALEQQHATPSIVGSAGGGAWPVACVVLAVLTWALPVGHRARGRRRASEKDQKGLAQRVAALEKLLKHFSRERQRGHHHRGQPAHCQRPGQHRLHGDRGRADSGLPERAGQPDRGLQRAARSETR